MLQIIKQEVRRITSDEANVHRREIDIAQALIDVIERVKLPARISNKIINVDRKVGYSGVISVAELAAPMRPLKLFDQTPMRESTRLRPHAADYEDVFAVVHL